MHHKAFAASAKRPIDATIANEYAAANPDSMFIDITKSRLD
jgi:hypothetical protein